MPAECATIGRAKSALTFGRGEDVRAVVTAVVARATDDTSGKRLRFAGPVRFSSATAKHIRQVVLALADRILCGLQAPRRKVEVSVVNLGGASAANLPVTVSGFSADVPVLLALLSAALAMPVPQDLVATGHVASPVGDITLVKNIAAKVAAAAADPATRRFLCPAADRDPSTTTLSPAETRQAVDALAKAKSEIQILPVGNVADLIQTVFSQEDIVRASLSNGFFAAHDGANEASDPVDTAVRFLTGHNEQRFRDVLEQSLIAGSSQAATELLVARAQYQISQQAYPPGLGTRLRQLLRSLPPATRRLKITYPLVPIRCVIEMTQFAGEPDHDDVVLLFEAASGRGIERRDPFWVDEKPTDTGTLQSGDAALETVVSEISTDTLTRTIGQPIDKARAVYSLDCITAGSSGEFHDGISAFYLHLLCHTREVLAPTDMPAVAANAHALLERAFAGHGGTNAAQADARSGTNGGMRVVLDKLTERFRTEEYAKHVSLVLKEALDPLEWTAKVAFMAALLERLGPHLPPDIRAQPPDRLAGECELVVRAYVESMDQVGELLRRL